MKQFAREIAAEQPRETLMADALRSVTIPLARHGYVLEVQTDTSLTYARTYRPWWVWILTICFFPIGLLAYFALAERAYVTMTFEQADDGALVRVAGEGTAAVSQAFATLTI
jgi:hypothetical protein